MRTHIVEELMTGKGALVGKVLLIGGAVIGLGLLVKKAVTKEQETLEPYTFMNVVDSETEENSDI